WIPELDLGLGLWQGEFQGIERLWLRWYDAQENWILTEAEQERQRAEAAETQLQSLLERLRESGIDPDTLLGG
ncbi:MAG: Uma2 family endonuclease, partial [Coleofasciculus sp. C2-GNP5-27]